MKLKATLAIGTALGLLLSGGAIAGSSNTLYLTQEGSSNTAAVNQANGNNSDIGDVTRALQDGDNNFFWFEVTNWGTNNDDDLHALKQEGNWNLLGVAFAGGSSFNDIGSVQQIGNGNSVRINVTQNSSSRVDAVQINGSMNTVSIYQNDGTHSGSGNVVANVTILGSGNGIATGNQWAHGDGEAAVHIVQFGSNNTVWASRITGDNNHAPNPWALGAFNKVHEITQNGTGNGGVDATAETLGSNGNTIRVTQTGNSNNFSVKQGISVASTGNNATITQTGDLNDAFVTQYGSNNQLIVSQIDDDNDVLANFSGDGNGSGPLTGVAGALDGTSSLLSQGTIYQDSTAAASGNHVVFNVTGSNNLFAMAQKGGSNTITGSVTNSNNNQVAVLQNGNGNTAAFTQTGAGGNNASISQ
jgi:hypothetical protein